MATNYIQPGETLTYTAPTGGVTSGTPVLIGARLVVPTASASAGDDFEGTTCGVWTLPKVTAETWTVGLPAFWDSANGKISTDASLGLPVGEVIEPATSSDTTGTVKLSGQSMAGQAMNIRRRFTIAEVNAGATLLAAVTGMRYRMIDAFAIAIGGAAAAVTTVDLIGTVTTARKLVAWAQASLTQSSLLRAGGTGAAILADGASFTANDISTAITIGKTGASVTTATHIDVVVSYTLE